ncbi:putative amino acid permease [Lentzea sp. NBRC 105346]|uniref:APC family permease n=1 Tax=Lentzea sp. NBRC 105346 TaxID=3032205 RepID=UPI0024A5F590|nr:APC family permease [Lentzea sp. NBRC 105346]GLZ28405.1 putative amino acid permease [Lentzea sp. NBRC 105346]
MSEVQPLSGNWLNERAHLRKSLRRVDVTFYLLCTLVGLDTIGSVAANGPQGLVWMVILAVVFFLPYGLLTAELGTAFPVEGGPYVWTKLAFGRMAAGINQVLYWISNPLWMGGTLAVVALATFETFFFQLGVTGKIVAGLAFIWAGVLAVAASLRIGKWVPIFGAFARIVLLGFFTISVIVYGIKNGVQPLAFGDFVPTYAAFTALVPVLIFNYVGFELPSTATEEMTDPQKTVPFAILRAGAAAFFLYGGPILGILLVVPADEIKGLGGFIDASKTVLSVYGPAAPALGAICAAGFIIGVLTSGVSWAIGAHRAQAVACADGAGPAWLGHLSARQGTPIRVNVLSGVLASIVLVVALNLTEGNTEKYFAAGLALVICTTFISYLLTFPSMVRLRSTMPNVARPFRAPLAWVCTILTTGLVAYTVVVLIWPPSLPSSFEGERLQYTLSQVVPLAIVIVIGLVFYALGRPTRAHDVAPDDEVQQRVTV